MSKEVYLVRHNTAEISLCLMKGEFDKFAKREMALVYQAVTEIGAHAKISALYMEEYLHDGGQLVNFKGVIEKTLANFIEPRRLRVHRFADEQRRKVLTAQWCIDNGIYDFGLMTPQDMGKAFVYESAIIDGELQQLMRETSTDSNLIISGTEHRFEDLKRDPNFRMYDLNIVTHNKGVSINGTAIKKIDGLVKRAREALKDLEGFTKMWF